MSAIQYYNYLVDICPDCNKELYYAPNPYYMYVCRYCKSTGPQSETKKGILVEIAEKIIQEKKDEIKRIEEHLKERINIYEEEEKEDTKFNRFEIMEI